MQKKISMIINATTVLLVIIAAIIMFSGITFMPSVQLLDSSNINMFKFFTVDSNILLGITTFIFLIYEIKQYKKKIKEIPEWVYLVKYVGVCVVTLTFVTTLLFLAPQYGFYALYNNSNLFFHLVIPVLSIISYMAFDKTEKSYYDALLGIIPMIFYSIYYTLNIILNYHVGVSLMELDFYGFLQGDIQNMFIAVPTIYLVDYLIAAALVFISKRIQSK